MTDLTKEELAELERKAVSAMRAADFDVDVPMRPLMIQRLLAMLKAQDAAVERASREEREAILAIGKRLMSGVAYGQLHETVAMRVRSLSGANAVASATSASPSLRDAALEALTELAGYEQEYRLAHDTYGNGDMRSGRAWDRLRRAGDKARAVLRIASLKSQEPSP